MNQNQFDDIQKVSIHVSLLEDERRQLRESLLKFMEQTPASPSSHLHINQTEEKESNMSGRAQESFSSQ